MDTPTHPTTSKHVSISRGLGKSTSEQCELNKDSALQVMTIWNDCYEMTSKGFNRPYGDVDFKNTPYADEATFNEQDRLIGLALQDTLSGHSFSIMKSSSFKYNKISWRFVIKGKKGTKPAIKQFMVELIPQFQEQQRKWGVLHPVALDLGIYDNNRKMRMLHSSKDGEDRPLNLVSGEPEDTLITYIPPEVEHEVLPEPPAEEEEEVEAPVNEQQPRRTRRSFEECVALMDALLVNRSWVNTYQGARDTIWAFWHEEQSDRMYDLLERIERPNHSREDSQFLRMTTRNYTPSEKPITLATIYWRLKELNPTGLAAIKAKFKTTHVYEIVGYNRPPHWPVYERWQEPSGHLQTLPEQHSTLLVDSHLGTGKTTQMKKIVKANSDKRILLISARRTFTASMFADWGEENGFVNYLDVKGCLADHKKVFVQVESLWRLLPVEATQVTEALLHKSSTGGVPPFDIVLMDEVESILAQCSPSSTHQDNYLKNMKVFSQVVRSAGRLIAMDAFITERSVEFLDAMREDIALIHNPYQPYKRVAIRTPANNIRESTSYFWKSVLTAVKAGKRVVIPCGSQKQGKAFEKMLKANNITYYFYHSGDDRKMRSETLLNVNEHWAKVQVLLYTPSITIGINYDAVETFDSLFMYASAAGGIPRDMFQGSLRARKINDDTLIYCLDKRAIRPSRLGLEEIESFYETRLLVNRVALTELCGYDLKNFHELEPWNKKLVYRNENEKNVSIAECEAVFNWYLEKCGYTVTTQEFPGKVTYETDDYPLFKDVRQITNSEADTIEQNKRNEQQVTAEEQHSLSAFYLLKVVPYFNTMEESPKEAMWSDWNGVATKHRIINVMSERKQLDETARHDIKKAKGNIDLMKNTAGKLLVVNLLLTALDGRTELSAKEYEDTFPDIREALRGDKYIDVTLKMFGIRDRVTKGKYTPLYYLHKAGEILKAWDGTEIMAVEEKRSAGGVYTRSYGLKITESVERQCLPLLEDEDEGYMFLDE